MVLSRPGQTNALSGRECGCFLWPVVSPSISFVDCSRPCRWDSFLLHGRRLWLSVYGKGGSCSVITLPGVNMLSYVLVRGVTELCAFLLLFVNLICY